MCTTNIYLHCMHWIQHAHIYLTQVSVHTVLPTAVAGVLSCPLLLAPLSAKCEEVHQFRLSCTPSLPPVATYNLPHLIYPPLSYPWWQVLHIRMFQTSSIWHPASHQGLWSHLHDIWRVRLHYIDKVSVILVQLNWVWTKLIWLLNTLSGSAASHKNFPIKV